MGEAEEREEVDAQRSSASGGGRRGQKRPAPCSGVSQFKYGGTRRGQQDTVLDFLQRRFPYFTQQQWKERIEQHHLMVNDAPTTPEAVLRNGDVLTLDTPREEEPAVDTNFRIMEEKGSLLAIEKPANLPVNESGKYRKNTMVHLLKEKLGRPVWSVHRLDKDTSGCVVVALSEDGANMATKLFESGAVEKVYYAVLRGELAEPAVVDQPVDPKWKHAGKDYCADCVPMKKIRMICHPDGKPCRTFFRPLRRAAGLTFAEIKIEQGRTHQIRVHAEHLGYPILGDKVYGHGEGHEVRSLRWLREEEPAVFGEHGEVPRQLLHAGELVLSLPDGPWALSSPAESFFKAVPACAPLFP